MFSLKYVTVEFPRLLNSNLSLCVRCGQLQHVWPKHTLFRVISSTFPTQKTIAVACATIPTYNTHTRSDCIKTADRFLYESRYLSAESRARGSLCQRVKVVVIVSTYVRFAYSMREIGTNACSFAIRCGAKVAVAQWGSIGFCAFAWVFCRFYRWSIGMCFMLVYFGLLSFKMD